MNIAPTLSTPRLRLVAITAALAAALRRSDVAEAEHLISATFPAPFALPPLLDDDLPQFGEALQANPAEVGWWGWLVIAPEAQRVVGWVMCTRPDPDGVTLLGWSVYPDSQGAGYATEASQALLAWAFAHADVCTARATIPPALGPSVRVAAKLGMTLARTESHPEVGAVQVFEMSNPRAQLA
jgi:RimJ/RimL family protein N-acetyltransferase